MAATAGVWPSVDSLGLFGGAAHKSSVGSETGVEIEVKITIKMSQKNLNKNIKTFVFLSIQTN